jgi:uncharacterized protein involved in oxidation of intracellular sulfur|tara:strand:- start:2267 stop:2587 length:321 start_codon:yes stop_codon:yes gene_type:complete
VKLGIVLNTNDVETSWNALRLGNEAMAGGYETNLFLLGPGVELQRIKNETFDVPEALNNFINSGGNLYACGTCLNVRQQEAGICPISTMSQLMELITTSDKIVTLG